MGGKQEKDVAFPIKKDHTITSLPFFMAWTFLGTLPVGLTKVPLSRSSGPFPFRKATFSYRYALYLVGGLHYEKRKRKHESKKEEGDGDEPHVAGSP